MGDDLDDAPVADLEAVAERAVDDTASPLLGDAVDLGELVDQAGGGEHSPCDHRVTAHERDPETAVAVADDIEGATGEDLDAVAANLVTADGGELRRRSPVMAEVAVHVGGGGVAWLTSVDDDDRAALAGELQGRRETRR